MLKLYLETLDNRELPSATSAIYEANFQNFSQETQNLFLQNSYSSVNVTSITSTSSSGGSGGAVTVPSNILTQQQILSLTADLTALLKQYNKIHSDMTKTEAAINQLDQLIAQKYEQLNNAQNQQERDDLLAAIDLFQQNRDELTHHYYNLVNQLFELRAEIQIIATALNNFGGQNIVINTLPSINWQLYYDGVWEYV